MIDVELRPPVVQSVLTLAPLLVVGYLLLTTFRGFSFRDPSLFGTAVPLVLLLVAVSAGLRLTARVRAHGDGRLEIRDRWFRTTHLQRSDVDRLMVDRAQGRRGRGGWRVEVLRRDGRVVPLDATERQWGQQAVLDERDRLAAWVEGRPVPPR